MVNSSKSEVILTLKRVACSHQLRESLPQVEQSKYVGVIFTSKGSKEWDIDSRIGAAATTMRTPHRSVLVKRKLSQKANLLIYRLVFVPTLTCVHKIQVMTERTRSWIHMTIDISLDAFWAPLSGGVCGSRGHWRDHVWSWKTLSLPQKRYVGRGKSVNLCCDGCPCDTVLNKRKIMRWDNEYQAFNESTTLNKWLINATFHVVVF